MRPLSLLLLIVLTYLFSSCCDPDIVVADYFLTEESNSKLAIMPDTLIYESGIDELKVFTEDGVQTKDTILQLLILCEASVLRPQWEVANTDTKIVQYVHENGTKAFEYAIEIDARIDGQVELDSFIIFERFYASLNSNKDGRYDGYQSIGFHINDLQNTYIEDYSNDSPLIADTIMNGNNYFNVYASISGPELFYTSEQGIVAFEYLNKMWYLRQ